MKKLKKLKIKRKSTMTKEEEAIALFGILSMTQCTIDYIEEMGLQCSWNKLNAKKSLNNFVAELKQVGWIPYSMNNPEPSTPQMGEDQLHGAKLLHQLFNMTVQIEKLEAKQMEKFLFDFKKLLSEYKLN